MLRAGCAHTKLIHLINGFCFCSKRTFETEQFTKPWKLIWIFREAMTDSEEDCRTQERQLNPVIFFYVWWYSFSKTTTPSLVPIVREYSPEIIPQLQSILLSIVPRTMWYFCPIRRVRGLLLRDPEVFLQHWSLKSLSLLNSLAKLNCCVGIITTSSSWCSKNIWFQKYNALYSTPQ